MKSFQFAVQVVLIVVAIIAIAHAQEGPIPFPPNQSCVSIPVSTRSFGQIYTLRPSNLGLQISLKQTHPTSGSFDPDVYARWNSVPTRSEYDYVDFTPGVDPDVSPTVTSTLDITIDQARRDTTSDILYIGVYAYSGTGTVELCYGNHQCLNHDCGRENNAGTCNEETHKCACNTDAGWAGDYCDMKQQTGKLDSTVELPMVPKRPHVVVYTATELTGELRFTLARPAISNDSLIIRASRGQIPRADEYDYEGLIFSWKDSVQISVDSRDYASGDWYVTVELASSNFLTQDLTVKLSAFHYLCPNDCSGHGNCKKDAATQENKCECIDGYTLSDCSFYGKTLHVNSTFPVVIPMHGETGFKFDVPANVTQFNVEMQFRFKADEECAPNCPKIYIAKSNSAATHASSAKFIATSNLPIPQSQSLSISDHDLEQVDYTVTIENTSSKVMKGKAEIHFVPHCANNCSGHGSCLWNGVCECHPGFHSSDCSMTKDKCNAKLPSKAGMGKFGLFVAIVLALALGGVGGIFFFKMVSKGQSSGSNTSGQQQLSADDQYSQLE